MKKKLVVITRSLPGAKAWMDHLEDHDIASYHFPTIATLPIKLSPEDVATLKDSSRFEWIIFTSAAGVGYFKRTAPKLKKMPKIAVFGEQTAEAVRKAGYKVAFRSSKADSKTLGKELSPVRGRSILLLRAAIASDELPELLKKRGGKVSSISLYRTKLITRPDPKFFKLLSSGRVGYLTFASPSAVRGFCGRIPKKLMGMAQAMPAIALGPSVSAALKKAGFKKIGMAKNPTIEALMAAMQKPVLQ